ncbi:MULTISPECIES: hypothetical protein [Ureibacillus]|uniref:Uncharacterized protein n=1 Tax=Ureibacillus thermosphaericus TaxID=51173 RepID=A0A840PQR6_URETH|nr:hypothetical protein [Ureibacillus thermosphaericus]MBB5148250.1 hypothetical protein [Ureibacillus thermosphaericus]NKZ31158.1 hypothetical protein [Ureibacillus thermosphaericus]
MSINKGQLIELIENLPKSAHITTYYYLKDLTKSRFVQYEIEVEDYSFINEQNKQIETYWIDAFMEYHLDSK